MEKINEKIRENIINRINYKNIIEFVVIVLLIFLSIKKGGFYKTDSLFFCVGTSSIYLIYSIFRLIENKQKYGKIIAKDNIDIISILLLLLSVFYMLPIIFKNYANLSDSIFEMIRYFNMYIIYKIVKNSNNKEIFLNSIIIITILQCIIGIDGLGNRYFSNILSSFNSGFLSKDITRLSGTIQYANVLAIMCSISLILVIEKIKINNKFNTIKIKALLYVIIFILISSLLLTGSRTASFLFVFIYFMYLLFNKKNAINVIVILLVQLIISIIYTALIQNSIIDEPLKVYIYTILFYIIDICSFFVIKMFDNNILKLNISVKKTVYITGIIAIIIYGIVALNISSPLLVSSLAKQNQKTVNLYNLNNDSINNISIKFNLNDPDTRYKFTFLEITDDFSSNVIKEINYYNLIKPEINVDYSVNEKTKYIKVIIECEKGSISIYDVKQNGYNKIVNYAIIPTEVISRIEDVVYGSTSSRDRIAYNKDSFKIIISNPSNFIIGVGGEGFKNMYELYKSFAYFSTEAHNSFLQIFIESGILGFMAIMSVILIVMFKAKNNYIKFATILLIIHSFFDLNFSYLLIMCIFAILLGCLDNNENKATNKQVVKQFFNYFDTVISLIISIPIIYILLNSNIAYNLRIPVYNNDELTLEKQIRVVNLMEKRVNLDFGENTYRKTLNIEYNKYLDMLFSTITTLEDGSKSRNILEEEARNIVLNIKNNADKMLRNSKYDRNVILEVSDIYFNNLTYFSTTFYENDTEYGYNEYLTFIKNNISFIKEKYPNNNSIDQMVISTYTKYLNELKEKNIYLKSNVISSNIITIDDILKDK